MTYKFREFPEIPFERMKHARLYPNREIMLAQLPIRRGGRVMEVGVALGEFSRLIFATLRPKKFYALDTFDMHLSESHWGTPSKILFGRKTHDQYFADKFADQDGLAIIKGYSEDMIPTTKDRLLDLIYIDAQHIYENVVMDAKLSLNKLKPGGIIIFNDYTLFDPYLQVPYGVVQAVNEFIIEHDFEVLGYALEKNMFCDIAVRKKSRKELALATMHKVVRGLKWSLSLLRGA